MQKKQNGPYGFFSANIQATTRNHDGSYTIRSQDIYQTFFGQTDSSEAPTLALLQKKYRIRTDGDALPNRDTCLRRAAFQGCVKDIEFLINNHGADVDGTSSNGKSALEWAYMNNQMKAFSSLCWLKADQKPIKFLWNYVTNTESEFPVKDLALCRAAAAGNTEDALHLIERYKANLRNNRYGNPVQMTRLNGHDELADRLYTQCRLNNASNK